MKQDRTPRWKFFPVAALLLLHSCTSDQLAEPEFCDVIKTSYDLNVKEIIDNSCAYTGCHDGKGGIGTGDYTKYSGLLNDLEDGDFRDRVIDRREDVLVGMPPNQSAYPESIKDDLTPEELEIITCWLNSGYPEN